MPGLLEPGCAVSSSISTFCLVGAFALIGVSPVAMAVASAPTVGQAAVVFDPRLDRSDLLLAVADAEASLVRFGALPGTVIVDMPEGGMTRLTAAGAWIIADPILLGGCQPGLSLNTLSNGA